MADRPNRALPGVLAVMLLTGCTTATAGSPTTGNTPAETTTRGGPAQTSEPNRYGAPRVANPLDPSKFFTDPCSAIPPAQRPGLGLTDPGESNTTGALGTQAPGCYWVKGDQGGSVGFLRGNRNGLADMYRGNDAHSWAYWEETTVEGYPAVFHGSPDRRSQGNCDIAVGLNDTLAMSVLADGRPGSSVCERAKQIAAVAIKTIKGAG